MLFDIFNFQWHCFSLKYIIKIGLTGGVYLRMYDALEQQVQFLNAVTHLLAQIGLVNVALGFELVEFHLFMRSWRPNFCIVGLVDFGVRGEVLEELVHVARLYSSPSYSLLMGGSVKFFGSLMSIGL